MQCTGAGEHPVLTSTITRASQVIANSLGGLLAASLVVNKPGDTAAYPTALQTKDGKIHVMYTSEKRTVINHAVFDESAILQAK